MLVQTPKITVGGAKLPDATFDEIVELRVEQTVSMPSQLTLRLSDPGFTIIDGTIFDVGKEIAVQLPDPADVWTTVFDGEIVSLAADQDAERIDSSEVLVTAFDRAHRLANTTRVRTFQNMAYSDVVSKIAQEEGLVGQVESMALRLPYLIQTTTNFSFLNEIAFRTGCEWSVAGRKLVFGQRTASAPTTVTYGTDVRRLKARFTAVDEAREVEVRSWDPQAKRAVVGRKTLNSTRQNRAVAGTAPLGVQGRTNARPFAAKLVTSAIATSIQAEAEGLAGSLSTRLAAADLRARCTCIGRPDIAAGRMVKIDNAGQRLSGEYYVTGVEHTWGRAADLTTTFTTGTHESSSLVDLLGGGAKERVDDFGRIGLTVGIVTNNKDPDGLGRVRLKFPQLSDSEESWWARVVTPGAAAGTGLMIMPQINDEVLVGFEQGDLRRPYVLGGLWSHTAKPPTDTSVFLSPGGGGTKVIEWGLKTAGGHTLVIRGGDQPRDKHFKVALADGTTLYLGSDKTEVIAQNKTLELKSGQASVLLTDKGDVELRGVNIKLQAQNAITIDAQVKVDAKATMVTATANSAMKVKGATVSVEGTGLAEVKAALVKIN